MNNRGMIFSAYVYVLLVFFLLALAALLFVLNNTKMLSDRIKEGSGDIVNQDEYDFSIELTGDSNICLNLGDEYSEPGFIAKDRDGDELPVIVDSNLDIWKSGTYVINYTTKYKNKNKTVSRKVTVLKNDYAYTGSPQEFIAGCDGYFKIELWGAQGASSAGGKGAYTKGTIHLSSGNKLYVYVGQSTNINNGTSFNGSTATSNGLPGGGATDVRTISGAWNNLNSLKSRIMVAAGGGSGKNLGYGGGLFGANGTVATGGTQTAGGTQQSSYGNGTFGIGGGGCGGGGGYYGGGGALCADGSGGGSSFISGYSGVNAITNDLTITHSSNTLHYSKKYFIDPYIEPGINTGNGKAKITYVGKEYIKRNPALNNVRYIRNCINGNSVNDYNQWVELQAIKDGVNIAYGKSVTGTTATTGTYDYSVVTDGDITSAIYASTSVGAKCITVDLGKTYDLDEIALWHYYTDGRTYHENVTSTSSDNSTWKVAMEMSSAETSEGQRINAYNTYATNLVKNGAFETLRGWDTQTGTNFPRNTVSGTLTNISGVNYLYINDTDTTSAYWNYTRFYVDVGDIIYFAADVNLVSGTFNLTVNDREATTTTTGSASYSIPTNGQFVRTSFRGPALTSTLYIQAGSSSTNLGTFYFGNVMAINLTKVFGAGNEPSKEWCDNNIKYYGGTFVLNKNW